ncbi:hypothetical protein MUP77_08185, partial [Candidatus Bathyarchaeota archaeon]|nr:hypothetical protein [Candidatus Bathyarchaeota archaeon]
MLFKGKSRVPLGLILTLIITLSSFLVVLASVTLIYNISNTGRTLSSMALHTEGEKIFNALKEEIFLKGIGRLHDMDDPRGWWSGPGEDFSNGRFEANRELVIQRIDANLQAMKSWGANLLRIHVAVNWWWRDNINPADYETPNTPILSYQDYIELLIERA